MSRILGGRKKGKSNQTGKTVQKPQIKKQVVHDKRKLSIEEYFKDMAQELKKQQEILAKKAQEGYAGKPKEADETGEIEKAQVKKTEKVQREGAYYFKDEHKNKRKEVSYEDLETKTRDSFESLFESPQDVVKGIIYSEILSKPKGLRKN